MTSVAVAPVAAYVSIGSNIAPERNLRMACQELREDFGELQLSSVHRSPAVGFDGDDFLNMVVGFTTTEQPQALLERMEELHRLARRVRLADLYSPRTLDLALLLYGILVQAALKLPHHDIDKYAFVLCPLAEIAPDLPHPVSGKSMAELWAEFDSHDCRMTRVPLRLD